MLINGTYFILVVVGAAFCCIIGSVVWFFTIFVKSRRKTIRAIVPVRYMPRIVIEEEIIPYWRRIPTKRERRKHKIRELKRRIESPSNEIRYVTPDVTQQEEQKEDEDGNENENVEEFPDEPEMEPARFSIRTSFFGGTSGSMKSLTQSSKFLNQIRGAFMSGYNPGLARSGSMDSSDSDLELGNNVSTKNKPNRNTSIRNSFSSKSAVVPVTETSVKQKRFVSQDRLTRAELRKSLIRTQSYKRTNVEIVAEVEETDNITSLLDLERIRLEKVARIVEQRKEMHKELKRVNAEKGVVDVVAINSGPPPSQIPPNYTLNTTVPDLTAEALQGKRVMVLWEIGVNDNEKNVTGWYLGSISGPSKTRNCNFNVKYDRAETGNLFVDGIRNMNLTFRGENAYGRRWVIVNKVGVVGAGDSKHTDHLQSIPPSSSINNQTSIIHVKEKNSTIDGNTLPVPVESNIHRSIMNAIEQIGGRQ